MVWVFGAAVFVLGLTIGSFLNAVVYRLAVRDGLAPKPGLAVGAKHGLGGLAGRSFCPHCGHQLFWQDLIPLLSFTLLRGRCRYCREKISVQYPLVELATGLLFLLVFLWVASKTRHMFSFLSSETLERLSFPQAVEVLYLWAVGALLIGIFVYDLRHYVIPDKLLYPAIALVFLWRLTESLEGLHGCLLSNVNCQMSIVMAAPLLQAFLAGLGASAFFLVIFLASRGAAMGFGDVKLAFFLGLFLGWPHILSALFFSFLSGAGVGLALISARKKQWGSRVPFGPFLVLGTLAALFWGDALVAWYLALLV